MLTRIEGEPCFKPKRVTMHITPKQFTVKEFVLKFLMKRIATYRVCPSTKVFQLFYVGVPYRPSWKVNRSN